MAEERIVDPPSVAPAMEGRKLELEAVWNESIESIESVGVGPFAPTASGLFVKSSEPFGFGDGRTVSMEDNEDGGVDSR